MKYRANGMFAMDKWIRFRTRGSITFKSMSVILKLAGARMCGIEASDPSLIVNLAFTVLMLSIATPGVPGVACTTTLVLISLLGLPAEFYAAI